VDDQEGVGGGLSGVSDGVCVPEDVALAEVLQPTLGRDEKTTNKVCGRECAHRGVGDTCAERDTAPCLLP